ncbi:MAG TPA: DUF1697 domain-containing protein, partial [Gemmatimonadales bacterium]|nr:DUF1697 domain-containing protein [Gemmatimonadales bacterium]
NVGGRVVPMAELTRLFGQEGMGEVKAYLASGNLSFTSRSTSAAALEQKLEAALAKALGYEVDTFVRTEAELVAAYQHPAYSAKEMNSAHTIAIGFMRTPLDPAGLARIAALANGEDEFRANGRELYQRNTVGLGQSKITGKMLERALGQPVTMRNIRTVAKLAAAVRRA